MDEYLWLLLIIQVQNPGCLSLETSVKKTILFCKNKSKNLYLDALISKTFHNAPNITCDSAAESDVCAVREY